MDERETERELSSSFVVGHIVDRGEAGYLIEFIGQGGEVLESSRGLQASFEVTSTQSYVRAKVTFTRDTPQVARISMLGCNPYLQMVESMTSKDLACSRVKSFKTSRYP